MKIWILALILLLFAIPASAMDISQMSDTDKTTFDKILEPVMKIYNFVKYTATLIALLVLLFSGINYMLSGYDIKKRDQAKNMATYVVIGLVVIWAAPFAVQYLLG
jgi:type IV secretory pathway VirB2 component (pilin)